MSIAARPTLPLDFLLAQPLLCPLLIRAVSALWMGGQRKPIWRWGVLPAPRRQDAA